MCKDRCKEMCVVRLLYAFLVSSLLVCHATRAQEQCFADGTAEGEEECGSASPGRSHLTPHDDPVPVTDPGVPQETAARDCVELYERGSITNGVYVIRPLSYPGDPFPVYCDMENKNGGWTTVQRRQDGTVDFNRTWEEYARGFGDLEGEFWLGLDKLHALTSRGKYILHLDFTDWEGNSAFSEYRSFRVGGEEDDYTLHLSGYFTGSTAGDAMLRPVPLDGMKFTTRDRDNDECGCNCAEKFGGGGWWYWRCGDSFLNGKYHDSHKCKTKQGIAWGAWKQSFKYSLKAVSMKIRLIDL
ncbi:angiopoietin-2-like [Branchiostoma lanceolatum]|uniref:angiopoietin-2-like n=1 Tax=Branchiostoma lanceolatum TaxID=7740 RepID=UPI00345222DD